MQYKNIITRHCINTDILIYNHDNNTQEYKNTYNHSELCEMINFWKTMLVEKYNVTKGQTILLNCGPNIYYYSVLFAALELGLILIVDLPRAYAESDLHSYNMNIHGKIDYIITQESYYDPNSKMYAYWDIQRNKKLSDNIIFQEDCDRYKIKSNLLYEQMKNQIDATPESIFLYSASSGTTGNPKKIINSHRKVYFMAERMARLLNFESDNKVLHTRNMHHGASIAYHFLPAFMNSKEQFTYTDITPPNQIKFIQENKINNLFLYTQQMLEDYLTNTPRVTHTVKINTLFNITLESAKLVKDKNIQFIKSLFGDTTIGQGFFLKHVDRYTDLTTYDVANQGKPLDDKFGIAVIEGKLHINIPELGEDWKTSNDKFDVINGDYYFRGRSNKYRINEEWVDQSEIESKITKYFGADANLVIDAENEKIYLAIWRENNDAELLLNKYFKESYTNVGINYVMQDQNKEIYFASRKLDYNKIREYCRSKLKELQ